MSPAAPLRIALFGPFVAEVGGVPLRPLRSRKGGWLLALLALRSPREVRREWLAETLWPESMPAQAYAGLRQSRGGS
jgi:DNA-binding SARP family transcriptional activator